MTIEEKRNAMCDKCNTYINCTECPIHEQYNNCYFNDDEWIESNYKPMFGIPDEKTIKTSSNVNHPSHYNREGAMECIDEMILVFGTRAVMDFCVCNAWKYRARALNKNGTEDMEKSDWYMKKYKELSEKDWCK